MDLVTDFEGIIGLCEKLETASPLPARLKRRIANAYSQAVGKAVVLGWYAKTEPELIADDVPFRTTLLRHAERGARDFVA
jgi:hypothetical protein